MTTAQPTTTTTLSTSNSMTTRERRRLLNSTRKIGAMLGASPVLTSPPPSSTFPISLYPTTSSTSSLSSSASSSRSATPDSTKASRRHASICAFHTGSKPQFVFTSAEGGSSVVSLTIPEKEEMGMGVRTLAKKASIKFKGSKPRPSNELPRPLVLRLNAIPQPITIHPPHSPTTFQPTSGSLTPTLMMDTPTPTTASPTTPVFPSPGEVRRKRIAKLSRTLGEIIPPYLVVSTSKRPLRFEEDSAGSALSPTSRLDPARRSRSMSVDFSSSSSPLSSSSSSSSQAPLPTHTTNPLPTPNTRRSSRVWITESQTWRGEWNRRDIRDVQRQLRSLKVR